MILFCKAVKKNYCKNYKLILFHLMFILVTKCIFLMVLDLINYNNPGDHTFTFKLACLYSLELACRPT